MVKWQPEHASHYHDHDENLDHNHDDHHGHFHVHDYEEPREYAESKELRYFNTKEKVIAHIVRHSHWDYSWYRRRPASRMREIQTINNILKARLPYTFEQTATVTEYIENTNPERQAEIKQQLQEGVYEMIPLFIQLETFLSGEEALFENIEYGQEKARSLGVEPSKALYIPDTFGQPDRFAQIAREAGYDVFIFERGLNKEQQTRSALSRIKSPDGSEILAVPMHNGYSNFSYPTHKLIYEGEKDFEIEGRPIRKGDEIEMQHHPDWADEKNHARLKVEAAAHAIKSYMLRYESRYEAIDMPHILFGNGNDFTELNEELENIMAWVEIKLRGTADNPGDVPGFRYQFGSFDEYGDLAKETLDMDKLPVYEGELRSAYERNILRGIESMRIPIKQAMQRTNAKIATAQVATSLLALGRKYNLIPDNVHETMDQIRAIRRAIQNKEPSESHDAISGCCTDDVVSYILSQLEDSWDEAEQVLRNSLHAYKGWWDNYPVHRDHGRDLSVVNTLPFARRSIVEVPMVGELQSIESLTAYVVDKDGQEIMEIPVQVDKRDKGDDMAVCVVDVDGLDSTQIRLKIDESASMKEIRNHERRSIENDFYAVSVLDDGRLRIRSKSTGVETTGLLFEECGDAGDEYNFSPTADRQTNFSTDGAVTNIAVVAEGSAFTDLQVDVVMKVPEGLDGYHSKTRSERLVDLPISTKVRLWNGIDRVDFLTTVENTARDHRLRVRFDMPNAGETVKAKEPYGMTERPAVPILGGDDWQEPGPIATSHNQGLIVAGDLAFMGKGLPEYEAIAGEDGNIEQIAITGLRGVGYLSRDDLETRRGGAGPGVLTPDAQLLGEHSFEYSISLQGSRDNSEVIRHANDYVHPLEHAPANIMDFQNEDGTPVDILKFDSEHAVMSVLRPTADGEAVVARFYNPDDEPTTVTLSGEGFRHAVRSDAFGNQIDDTNARSFDIQPQHMVTVRIS